MLTLNERAKNQVRKSKGCLTYAEAYEIEKKNILNDLLNECNDIQNECNQIIKSLHNTLERLK